ncbi:MAG: acyltransferase [Pseudomonadota bacterium]|nr:acyltransferase [Pseudomonadota bacterium]
MDAHGRHTTIVEIQHLRAIAVLLVVLAHIHQADARFLGPALLDRTAFFGFIGVDIFFVLSGFIIHHLYSTQTGFDARYFLKRLNRIFPLYWIFTGLALTGYLVFGDSLTRGLGEIDLVASLTLIPTGELPLLLVGWTLTHEIYFYIAFGIVLMAPRAWRPWLAAGWAVSTLVVAYLLPETGSPWLDLLFSPFNLLFLAGCLISAGRMRLEGLRWPALILTIAGAAGALAWTRAGGLESIDDSGLRVPVFAPFAIGIVLAWLAWKPRLPALAAQIGDWSYAIYLGHVLAIGVLARLLPAGVWSLAFYALCLAACLVLGWLTHIAVERPLLRAGKGLIDRYVPRAKRERT